MRILGFSKKWDKLHLELPVGERPDFTTFRFQRRDSDWAVGERVQLVYKPRSKDREVLGTAEIIGRERRAIRNISEDEAIADGFRNTGSMWNWLKSTYKFISMSNSMNKLTLRWNITENSKVTR